ncbi:MAG: M60 family metallopeptidase [Crocinitomicaceae bacterium]|nr:M60 family metallopeptidase [Crocinitomicaceae bacterium]
MKFLVSILFAAYLFTTSAQLYPVSVYAVTTMQPAQSGEDAYKMIDGNPSTMYHSQWYSIGIPDEVNFYFTSQAQSIKEIVYTPRQAQTNGIWTTVDVLYATQNQPTTFIPLVTNLTWSGDNTLKTITLPTAIQNVAVIRFAVQAGVGNFSSCAEMSFYSDNPPVPTSVSCVVATAELEVDGANDVKIPVQLSGSFASSFQSGENIEKSFDGDLTTLYHSSYGNTQMPVTLNYRFDGSSTIEYLKYIPRTSGSNGNFGNVTIQYNTTTNSVFVPLLDYNFNQGGQPVSVHFPTAITPLNIQLIVHDGYGDWASCAEMEFYRYGTTSNPSMPIGIFADNLCSQLLPSVTQTEIDQIASSFYKSLAQCIFDGTYNHQFRVQDYEVFKSIQQVSQELKVGGYDPYENATGIAFHAGDKVAVFAENVPYNAGVYLQIKDFISDGFWGAETYYPLKNGLNVVEVTTTGLGYISYFNSDLSLPAVSLNIVSGEVNGYFDLAKSTSSQWPDLLLNDTYPKMDIRGEFAHLVFDKDALRSYCPLDGMDLIKKYDTIIRYERMLMGLFKYNKSPKNHMLTYSDTTGGWYAGGPGVHLDLTWGPTSVLNPNQLDVWGIPHEYGHVNQLRRDLNWIGTTEVTNNVYSVWVQYNMNHANQKYTRLEAEVNQPSSGMPAVAGGTINGAINSTFVNENPLQQEEGYDVFKVLVPFWQLELYYQLAGASRNAPDLTFDYPGTYTGFDYARWYGTVCELSRNTNSAGLSNGDFVMNFVKNTCAAVQEDLTDFFINSGFLRPVNATIDDYGVGTLLITQQMIDATIAEIQSHNYPQPVSPVINYLSAHSVDAFKNKASLTGQTGVGVTVGTNSLTIQNNQWNNAVAFETYDDAGNLMHVAIVGTGDISLATTTIYYPANALGVYAVGYDGQKILVYPIELKVDNKLLENIVVYPNPTQDYLTISSFINIDEITIMDLDGHVVNQQTIGSKEIQLGIQSLKSGVYLVRIITDKGSVVKKIIKK